MQRVLRSAKPVFHLQQQRVKNKRKSYVILGEMQEPRAAYLLTELESWIPMIGDVMAKITHEKYEKAVKSGDKTDQKKFDGGYKLLDKNRSFSKSQKESAEVEQEWECYYHYYCGNMVGEGNDSVGDHSDVVHTKYYLGPRF